MLSQLLEWKFCIQMKTVNTIEVVEMKCVLSDERINFFQAVN